MRQKPLTISVNGETGRDNVTRLMARAIREACDMHDGLELERCEIKANGPDITDGHARLLYRDRDDD